jgi:hypothetical protein
VRRVGPPARAGLYPLWAWYRFDGIRRPRPDLRTAGFFQRGTPAVLWELEVPEGHALLSDFQRWHAVLNRVYLPCSEADAQRFEADLRRAGIPERWPYPEPFREQVLRSWQRIFDLEDACDAWEPPAERQIQAALWELPLAWVRRRTPFIAR